jgi:hypothetical protein
MTQKNKVTGGGKGAFNTSVLYSSPRCNVIKMYSKGQQMSADIVNILTKLSLALRIYAKKTFIFDSGNNSSKKRNPFLAKSARRIFIVSRRSELRGGHHPLGQKSGTPHPFKNFTYKSKKNQNRRKKAKMAKNRNK